VKNGPQLNNLYAEFRAGNSDSFNNLYEALAEHSAINRSIVLRSGCGNANDALTIFDDVLMRLIRKDNVEDFSRAFLKSLRNARVDYFRKWKRTNGRLKWIDDITEDDEGAATSTDILRSDYVLEDDVTKKNEAEKLSLVDFILDSAKNLIGPEMTAIIKGLPDYDSVNEAATSLGMHRNQIARPLARLTRFYNREVHGDLRDYFPKDTRLKREFISA